MSAATEPVRGMHDVMPEQQDLWDRLEGAVKAAHGSYGYRRVRTPVLEHEDLFRRTVGGESDIVTKELFSVDARGKRAACMRPEGTVPAVRALANLGLLRDRKRKRRVWYMGPMFRRERPQRGRLRQFHQFGAELLGVPGYEADAEIVLLCAAIWREIGIADRLELAVNNLGGLEERRAYADELRGYLAGRADSLSATDRARVRANPLRVLDSKEEGIDEVLAEAPVMKSHIGKDSQEHFESFRRCLDNEGIAHRVDDRLVRGLEYYTLTVFEWAPKGDERRQSAVCGGGRYDGLAEALGSDPCPGTGMAAGVERILEMMLEGTERRVPDVYIGMSGQVYEDEGSRIRLLEMSEQLRKAGFSVETCMTRVKISMFFQLANESGASLAALVGKREHARKEISIKSMATGVQDDPVPQAGLADRVKSMLKRGEGN